MQALFLLLPGFFLFCCLLYGIYAGVSAVVRGLAHIRNIFSS